MAKTHQVTSNRDLELTSEFPEMTPLSKFANRITQNLQYMCISQNWEGQNPVLRLSTPGCNLLPLQGTPARLPLTCECQTGAQGTGAAVLSWVLAVREAPCLGRTGHWLRQHSAGTPCPGSCKGIPSDTAQERCGKMGASGHPSLHEVRPNPETTLPPWEGALLPHRHTPHPE